MFEILDGVINHHARVVEILKDSALLKTVEHPFSPDMMDAGAKATRISCQAIQDLMLNEAIVVDDIFILNHFHSQITRTNTNFISKTALYVVRTKQNRVVAVLYEGADITGNPE